MGKLGTGDDTTLPEGNFSEQFQYDLLGRETLHISFEGMHAQSVYDEQTGRLAERRFYASAIDYTNHTPAETWTYTYDAFGREAEVVQTRDSDVRTVTTAYNAHRTTARTGKLDPGVLRIVPQRRSGNDAYSEF